MTTMFLVHGKTKSGKTTAANYLADSHNCVMVDSIAPLRRMYETVYSLPHGTLDTQSGKAILVPDTNHTFQEQLIKDYFHWKQTNRYFASNWVYNESLRLLDSGISPVFQNIRNLEEMDKILKLVDTGYKLVYIKVEREGSILETSDEFYRDIAYLAIKATDLRWVIDNNLDKTNLYRTLDRIVQWTMNQSV